MVNVLANAKDVGRRALADVLAAHVGKGRVLTRDHAARAIGCAPQTLDNIMTGETECGHTRLMAMFIVFGANFANAYLERFGFTGVRPMTRQEQCDRDMNCRVTQAAAMIAEALADGFIDHQERARLEPKMRELRDTAENFLAAACGTMITSHNHGAQHVAR